MTPTSPSQDPDRTIGPPDLDIAQLDKKRALYRAKLTTALSQDEDPLAAYERFIKWTIDSYPPDLIPKSGLLELLEEATRHFKNDQAYKSDIRYAKLWILYAAYVDDDRTNVAVPVYRYMVQNNIGTAWAQVYEEYAAALERAKRYVIYSVSKSLSSIKQLGTRMQRGFSSMV